MMQLNHHVKFHDMMVLNHHVKFHVNRMKNQGDRHTWLNTQMVQKINKNQEVKINVVPII